VTTAATFPRAAKPKRVALSKLAGASFGKAHAENEIAYHRTGNG
jgi:predicted outer membrane protein